MQSAEAVVDILRARGRRGLPCDELYRQLFNPALFLMAWGRIYANDGAMTPGACGETEDGMSLAKIGRIIDAAGPSRRSTMDCSTFWRRAISALRTPAATAVPAPRLPDPACPGRPRGRTSLPLLSRSVGGAASLRNSPSGPPLRPHPVRNSPAVAVPPPLRSAPPCRRRDTGTAPAARRRSASGRPR